MKLVYQYVVTFCNFLTTSSHLRPLQVENCGSNSQLVVDEDDNDKFRIERVNIYNSLKIPHIYLFQVVIDLLKIHVIAGSTTRSVMDKLAKDPLLVLVKQLLVEIPMHQELDFMSEILLELVKIGFRKWSCDEFPMLKPSHYRVAFLNIRHMPQDQIKYTKSG